MSDLAGAIAAARPVAFELVRIRLDLVTPLRSAHGVEPVRDVILVRAIAEDGEGWGECSALSAPTYTGEHTGGAWDVLSRLLLPAALSGERPGVRGHPMAAAALELALVDLELRRAGESLAGVLGGVRTEVELCAVVGFHHSVEATLDVVDDLVAAGYRHVKLKLSPERGIADLSAVRDRHPELDLAADCNGSFAEADLGALRALDDLRLTYIEQPMRPDALVACGNLATSLETPIALDESITSLDALRSAVALGAIDIVNVKAPRVGGLLEAVAIADEARSVGVGSFVGGMLETGVGRAAALALASSPAFAMATDLGPSDRYFAEDITEPHLFRDGCMSVPTGAGTGFPPRPQRLAEAAVERRLIER